MESANNKPKIILYTLTRDRLDYTKQTFEGMRKTAGIEFDHFILDNGSEDGTQDWLRKWRDNNSNTKLYLAKENMGLWSGINTILSKTNFFEGYDFVCKLDNDVDFNVEGAQDWLLRLYRVAMSAIGEQWVFSPYVDGLGNNSGGAPRMGVDLIHNKQVSLSSHVGGICLFTDRNAYKVYFPTNKAKAKGWDVFFCSYLRGRGYRTGYLEDIAIKHMDTTSGQNKKYPKYYERKRKEFQEVYLGNDRGDNI